MTAFKHDQDGTAGFVSTSPNVQDGGPPLFCCLQLHIQHIRNYAPYWRPFVHPQPKDAPRRGDRDPLIMEKFHLMQGKNKLSFEYKRKNKRALAIKYHPQQRTVKSTLNSAHTKHQKKVNSQVQDSADLATMAIGNAIGFPQTFINSVQSETISKLMPVFMTDGHQINFFTPL